MYEIDLKSVTRWISARQSNLEVPHSVDAKCPLCDRSPITFSFEGTRGWQLVKSFMYTDSNCPGCHRRVRFWLIDPPKLKQNETRKASHLYMFPKPTLARVFNEGINSLSPNFVEIFNQSLIAEESGLNQLSGAGYRKALEFLVKDFLSNQVPDEKANIQKTFLGTCISKHIEDSKLKSCAERAAWLGNDETHYVRRWQEHDLQDLKRLLELTIHWVELELDTQRYLRDMTD